MDFWRCDEFKVWQMEIGVEYAITQGGNGYSTGVLCKKEDKDHVSFRHFWVLDKEDYDKEEYSYDERTGFYFSNNKFESKAIKVHRNALKLPDVDIMPDCSFDDLTLSELYNGVYLQVYMYHSGDVIPTEEELVEA